LIDLFGPGEQEFARIKIQSLKICEGIVKLDRDRVTQANPGEDMALGIAELELVEAQRVDIARADPQTLRDGQVNALCLNRRGNVVVVTCEASMAPAGMLTVSRPSLPCICKGAAVVDEEERKVGVTT
jgi:hypothetical protein